MRPLLLLSLALLVGWIQPPAAPHRGLVASVDTVKVTPALDTLFGKQPFSLTARVVDSVGRTKNANVTWTVRDSSLFRSLKQGGTYHTTLKAFAKGDTGRTYAVAFAGTKKDSALIIVRDTTCDATVLGSLQLGLDSITMTRKDTAAAVVLPRNQCGGLLSGVDVTWASSDTAGGATITRVDSLIGRIISVDSVGVTYIKAINGTVRDSVKVNHNPAP